MTGRVFGVGPECGRCHGGKYQCSLRMPVLGDLNEREYRWRKQERQ